MDFDFGMFDPTSAGPGLLDTPGARAALLQTGLQLMSGQGGPAQVFGAGAEAFNRNRDATRVEDTQRAQMERADRSEARAERQLANSESNTAFNQDQAKRRLSLSERIAAQRRGGGTSQPAPGPTPPITTATSGGLWTPPGTTAQGSLPTGAPATAPVAPKPPVSEFITKYPDQWAKLKQKAQNGTPQERAQAAAAIGRLRGMVNDPASIDTLLGS